METLHQLWSEPGHFRFLVQPLMALLLGVRDGRADAKGGRPPYVWALVSEPEQRRVRVKQALRTLAFPLSAGVGLSLVFQWIVRSHVHVLWAVAFGAVFVAFPYVLVRALTNRFSR